jgi:hypothetical protein
VQPPYDAVNVKGLLPIKIDCVVVEFAAKLTPELVPQAKEY